MYISPSFSPVDKLRLVCHFKGIFQSLQCVPLPSPSQVRHTPPAFLPASVTNSSGPESLINDYFKLLSL